jgi:hypothetical protein
VSSRSLIEHWFMNIYSILYVYLLFIPCLFWQSICHSTYALYDTPFMTYINSHMFWYWGAILRESFVTKVYKPNANQGYNQYIIQKMHTLWYSIYDIHQLIFVLDETCKSSSNKWRIIEFICRMIYWSYMHNVHNYVKVD